MHWPRRRASTAASTRVGFTLVELLVVIGIIAILISVLLPSLAAARRSAQQVKCLASLSDIGRAFFLYANDNKQVWPVVRHQTSPAAPGSYAGTTRDDRWNRMLLKYITKRYDQWHDVLSGGLYTTGRGMNDFRETAFFGCVPYGEIQGALAASGARLSTGYGMQAWPTMTPTFTPASTGDPNGADPYKPADITVQIGNYGKYYPVSKWTQPAERILVADARSFWLNAFAPVGPNGTVGPQSTSLAYDATAGGPSTDSFDRYRHGKRTTKVSFNVLYCDGHAANLSSIDEGYRGIRMKFPG